MLSINDNQSKVDFLKICSITYNLINNKNKAILIVIKALIINYIMFSVIIMLKYNTCGASYEAFQVSFSCSIFC